MKISPLLPFTIIAALTCAPLRAQDTPPAVGAANGPYALPPVMRITIEEAIEMALQNNIDIAIQRIRPRLAEQSIDFERGAYDPLLRLGLEREEAERPNIIGDRVFAGRKTDQRRFTSSLTGRVPFGTRYTLTANMTRFQEPDTDPVIKENFPDWIGFAGVELRQPLLKNFGLGANQAPIWIARKNKEQSEHELTLQLLRIVGEVQTAYYDLVFALDRVRVQNEALILARTLLEENKKKLDAGILSPLEVTQAEAGVAKAESDLLTSQRLALNQENLLKLLISRDVYKIRHTRVEPDETMTVVPVSLDLEESIRLGLQYRPDYLAAKTVVEREKIQVRFTKNQAFPELDIFASYGLNSQATTIGKSIDQLAKGSSPTISYGVELQTAIPNRQPRANLSAAKLNHQIALEQMKKAEQIVIVDVDNAIGNIALNLKRVEATRNARIYAEESLKAEDTKYKNGVSTSFQVLQAQTQLTTAKADEIRAITDYNKSLADLHRVEGTLLQRHSLTLKPDKK